MFERKLTTKKEKVLDQENSQLIIQTLDFTQGLQSDINTLQTDVNTLQSEMDQAQTDINALQPLQSDVNQLQTDVNTLQSEMDQAQTDINIIEADYLKASNISDIAYNQSTWNTVTTIAPSKNAVRDKFESLDSEKVSQADFNAHRHDGHTLELDGIDSNGGAFDFKSSNQVNFKVSSLNNNYLFFHTSASIPRIGVYGNTQMYFHDGTNWETIHADDFTPHSAPLPIEMSTEKILLIKNVLDGSKLDYSSIPIDCYYSEKDGKNEGYKMNKMMLHLIKTIQELELRIKELEK